MTLTTRNGTCRRAASAAAHRTARKAYSEPSTPTTTGDSACCPVMTVLTSAKPWRPARRRF